MGFLGGFLLGRETANSEHRNGGVGIVSSILVMLMIAGTYKWLEDTSVRLFGNKIIDLVITYVLMSILLYRYISEKRSLSINIIGLFLQLINIFLCVILSFCMFSKLGNTPFGFLIEYLNVLNWGTHNSFLDVIGEIIWLILISLHIITKPLFFLYLQKYSIRLIKISKKGCIE